jgi:hypothetical protein
MAVAFSAKATVDTIAAPLTSTVSLTNLTVGGSDTALVATTSIGMLSGTIAGASIVCTGMTWNGVAMTLLGSATATDGTCVVYLFGLANPAPGAKTLTASYTGTFTQAQAYLDAASFTGSATTTAAAFPSADVVTDASHPNVSGSYPGTPFSVNTISGDAALASMNDITTGFGGVAAGTLLRADSGAQGNDTWGFHLAVGSSTTMQFTGSAGTTDNCCGVAIHIAQPGGIVPFLGQGWM